MSKTKQNFGNNALAQSGGNGKYSGNSPAQGIGQSQSSNQNAQCVAGGDINISCNNLSVQDQTKLWKQRISPKWR